jgi:hypothetical protein
MSGKSPYRDALVILAYFIITLLMTYPVILNFFSHVPGGGGDIFSFLWNFWWVKKALLELHATPYFSYFVSYPTGENLALRPFALFDSLLAIPLQGIFNMAATYNALFLLGFMLSGYGAYSLVRYLTGDDRAAFISGLMFAFCPYRFAHALTGQLNLLSTEFIPFYVLFLIKTCKEKGVLNPVLAGFFLFLTALCDWQYMFFMAAFTILFFAYRLWFERNLIEESMLKRCGLMMVVSGLMILPFAYPAAESTLFIERAKTPIGFSISLSADLLSFVLPSQMHPLFGGFVDGIYKNFTGGTVENNLFVGFSVMALTVYYMLRMSGISSWIAGKIAKVDAVKRNWTTFFKVAGILLLLATVYYFSFGPDPILYIIVFLYSTFFAALFYVVKDKKIDFWLLSAIVFFLLSLGPLLHIAGEIYFIPFPYIVFPFLPVLSFLRDPARFGLLVMLSLAVISGYAMTNLLKGMKRKNTAALLVSIIVLFEFLAVPYPLTELTIPEFYDRLAENPSNRAVLDVPVPRSTSYSGRYMFYQTKHEKKMVGGYIGITSEKSRNFLENTPLIQDLRTPLLLTEYDGGLWLNKNAHYRPDIEQNKKLVEYFNKTKADYLTEDGQVYAITNTPEDITKLLQNQTQPQDDIIRQDNRLVGQSVLSYYSIGFIIIHRDDLSEDETKAVMDILAGVLQNMTPVYASEGLIVYQVPETEAVAFAVLGENWYVKEPLDYVATRWMSNNATLWVLNAQDGAMELGFEARSLGKNRELDVYVNNEHVGRYAISQDYSRKEVRGMRLKTGDNVVSFYTPDGCIQQENLLRSMLEDETRCVSLAFRNISVTLA